jgi:hypothetical protein
LTISGNTCGQDFEELAFEFTTMKIEMCQYLDFVVDWIHIQSLDFFGRIWVIAKKGGEGNYG